MKNTIDFDEGKVAQMSATFAITIFLSLTLLLTKENPEYSFLLKLLWTASGLFCGASIRLLDRIFDHNKDFKVKFSMFTVKGRSFFSLDERWLDGRFTLYFFGWLFFLSAYFIVGIFIFTDSFPTSFSHFFVNIYSDMWLFIVFLLMVFTTFISVTREFLFIN